MRSEVAELRDTVEQLYNRLGHPYPGNEASPTQSRRKTGS
jgi:hypothetical protein